MLLGDLLEDSGSSVADKVVIALHFSGCSDPRRCSDRAELVEAQGLIAHTVAAQDELAASGAKAARDRSLH